MPRRDAADRWSAEMVPHASGHAAYLERRHFADLDGLRCLCIAMVLWHHAPLTLPDAPQIASRGFLGVDFFFVLSGFLITTLLLRERREHGRIRLLDFYRRRALRILPPYYLLVGLVSSYFILVKGETQLAGLVPYYFLFLANFLTTDIPLLSITWPLAVEEQYYAVWPVLLMLLPRATIVPALLGLIALNIAGVTGATGVPVVERPPLRLEMFPATFAPILMGSLAAWLLDNRAGFAAFARIAGWPGAPVAWLAALALAMQFTPQDVVGWPNLLIHTLMTLALVSLVVVPRGVLSPLLRARPVARVGAVSYGIYLYHLIGLHIAGIVAAKTGLAAGSGLLITYLLLSWLIAEASFRWIETPFLRLRHRPREVVGPLDPHRHPVPQGPAASPAAVARPLGTAIPARGGPEGSA